MHKLWYPILWASLTALAVILWLSSLDEARVPIAFGYVAVSVVFVSAVDFYARRRLIRRAGLAGRGLFGRLRGWMKTGAVEFAADGRQPPPGAEREFIVTRRIGVIFVGATCVIAVLLVVL